MNTYEVVLNGDLTYGVEIRADSYDVTSSGALYFYKNGPVVVSNNLYGIYNSPDGIGSYTPRKTVATFSTGSWKYVKENNID